jgi:hypothetical protein
MNYSAGEGDSTEGSPSWLVPVGAAVLAFLGFDAFVRSRAQARARHPAAASAAATDGT